MCMCFSVCAFYLEIIHWNAAIIVMVSFGAHSIKDVSRVKVLQNCMQLQKREILKFDKKDDTTSGRNVCEEKSS